jgi:hypothetical protein
MNVIVEGAESGTVRDPSDAHALSKRKTARAKMNTFFITSPIRL